jgi:NAD(P)-dependent dehydrogenase (short-subunit alcohol dehydrogenase family)
MGALAGKTATVTGAGSGIGARHCQLCALVTNAVFQFQDWTTAIHSDNGDSLAITARSDPVSFFA